MKNVPKVNLGIVAVSRDCFPVELSRQRRNAVVKECRAKKIPLAVIETIVENEKDALKVLEEIRQKNVNALVIYLGNFGPEGPTTLLAQKFGGPVMFAAAAEESGNNLIQGRGDAYCGMLNASYNVGLRKLRPHIPEYPVGTPEEVAEIIRDFRPVARIMLGLKKLKIFAFGPRPQDFLACNAPIKPLYDIGVEIMENSELDLYDIFLKAKGNPKIKPVARDMAKELGQGNAFPDMLEKLAQYEVALTRFMENNLGASEYGVFANKCWPAYESYFGFVPCYVNSRLATRGIPVSCEVDIYGALSEYMATCATEMPATLLDINNTVPYDMIRGAKKLVGGYKPTDLFMGFHCGNTSSTCLIGGGLKYQLIMHRLMESDKKPDITRGTLEGRIRAGEITIFRLQSTADTVLKSYVAQGEVLDIDPKSFGGIGVFAIKDMGRFYRHVLIEKRFPHHTAVAFAHAGKALFSAVKMLGVEDIGFNQPSGMLYQTENPF
ncbi:MAG: fucose isomerase [Candidatus Aminicenantes bacterium]|nr:fucose isomerase [Candidatus Aminicenantes bacterium]